MTRGGGAVVAATVTVLLVTAVRRSAGLDVLAVFPFSGKSHYQMFRAVSDALVARGHDVTVVGHFPETAGRRDEDGGGGGSGGGGRTTGTRVDYSLAGTVPVYENFTVDDVADDGSAGYLQQFLVILQDGLDNCEGVFSSGRLDRLVRTGARFDVVLVEVSEASAGGGGSRVWGEGITECLAHEFMSNTW